MTKHGFKDASQNVDIIQQWWTKQPAAMIGMPTGAVSNVLVVDIDIGAEPPDDVMNSMQMEYGDFADAPLVRTPRGGLHIYFQHDPRIRINGSGKTWKPQVDWRGDGGYVCVPPSRNDKGAYELIRDGVLKPPPADMIAAIVAAQGGPSLAVVGGVHSLQYQATLKEIAEAIKQNKDWHANTNVLIARWTAAYGIPPDEWVNLAPFLQQPGYSLEQTIKEIHVSAEGAYRKYAPEQATKAPPEGLKLWGIDELETRPQPDWLVGGVIPEGCFFSIYGDSNTFKTFAMLDLALCVAHGVPWMGRPVKPAPVLYVLGEGQGSFAGRVKAWRTRWDDRACAGFWTLLQPLSLPDRTDMKALMDAVGALPAQPALVIVDTLARNFGPGNPDSSQDMSRFVNAIDLIRQTTGAAVGTIHHAGKNKELGARNSSVLRAALDVEMHAEREEGSDVVRIRNTKQKDAEEFQPIQMRMEKTSFEDPRTGELTSSLVARFDSESPIRTSKPNKLGAFELRICAALEAGGSLTVAEVAIRAEAEISNTRKTLARMWREGVILRDNGPPQTYNLPEQFQ